MPTTLTDTPSGAESLILDLHGKYLEEARPSEPFKGLNLASVRRFETLKFPHPKHDLFSFVNAKELAWTRFQLQRDSRIGKDIVRDHVYPGCEKSVLVVADGTFRPDLSDLSALPSQVKVSSLREAVADPAIARYLAETIESENDVFAAINGAFFNDGLYLEVEPAALVETPALILYISSGSASHPTMTVPRVLAKVGRHSEVKIVVKYAGAGGNYFVNSTQDFILEENSKVLYTHIQADPFESWSFAKDRVHLNRYSRFHGVNVYSGCKLARRHHEVHLEDSGAELKLDGVSVLTGREQAHNLVRIHHEAPQCASAQHFKNIVNESSRSSFDGSVIVNKGAQLTNSDQLINNLMLSDDAHADSKPNLMIYADDVKCTHGSTVGQLDEEQLFYLNSRGLSQGMAKSLLTRSFAESILGEIQVPAVASGLRGILSKKLEANHA
ncbi:MAG: Fe-S cluster assembly protein SufD [Nitrospinae bacterium]|nr:Fe-S cluster assembly protein SufD [Nitrospinota bacterium]